MEVDFLQPFLDIKARTALANPGESKICLSTIIVCLSKQFVGGAEHFELGTAVQLVAYLLMLPGLL